MPSGINENENDDVEEIETKETTHQVINKTQAINDPRVHSKPDEVCNLAKLVQENNREEQRNNKGIKRIHQYNEIWSDPEEGAQQKKMKLEKRRQFDDLPLLNPTSEQQRPGKPQYKQGKGGNKAKPSGKPNNQAAMQKSCRKPYYRKRRYCCPGKRRYKAKKRCCPSKKYNRNRINICNRNWARISVNPFINFLRVFRRKFCKGTSPTEIARKGRCEWKKMSCNAKKKFYEQAKRARIRGYRT